MTPTPGICDRTQQVQDGILAAVSGADECNEVTVADLATVTSLVLDRERHHVAPGGRLRRPDRADAARPAGQPGRRASGEPVLRAHQFADPRSVYDAGVTSLPADAFSGLTALTKINLGSNSSIGSLPADQFSGLANLEKPRAWG